MLQMNILFFPLNQWGGFINKGLYTGLATNVVLVVICHFLV